MMQVLQKLHSGIDEGEMHSLATEILQHKDDVIVWVNNLLQQIPAITNEEACKLYLLHNIYAEENGITHAVLNGMQHYLSDNIASLATGNRWFIIQLFLDTLGHSTEVFPTDEARLAFVSKLKPYVYDKDLKDATNDEGLAAHFFEAFVI